MSRPFTPEELLGFPLPSGPMDRGRAEALAARVAAVPVDWARLAPHIAFDPRGYVRERLYRGADWEMLLIGWLPGQKTVIHDHGGSWGVVRVLAGALAEELFARNDGGAPARLERRAMGPERAAVETAETIHRNENVTGAPVISLHLYAPPLTVLNSYDEATGARHEVRVDELTPQAVGGNPRIAPVR